MGVFIFSKKTTAFFHWKSFRVSYHTISVFFVVKMTFKYTISVRKVAFRWNYYVESWTLQPDDRLNM